MKYSNECDDEYFTVQVEQLSISGVLAKEFKYHRSCYRTIPRPPLIKYSNKCLHKDLPSTKNMLFRAQETYWWKNSYERWIRNNVLPIRLLRATPREKRNWKKETLVRNLKVRLVNTYGDDIAFFQKSGGLPEVVYSTRNFSDNAGYETKETTKSIAKMIRQELLSAPDVFVSWPPGENQLLQGNFRTPELTKLLLTWILPGKGKST